MPVYKKEQVQMTVEEMKRERELSTLSCPLLTFLTGGPVRLHKRSKLSNHSLGSFVPWYCYFYLHLSANVPSSGSYSVPKLIVLRRRFHPVGEVERYFTV
jgi:hypothetical protein